MDIARVSLKLEINNNNIYTTTTDKICNLLKAKNVTSKYFTYIKSLYPYINAVREIKLLSPFYRYRKHKWEIAG